MKFSERLLINTLKGAGKPSISSEAQPNSLRDLTITFHNLEPAVAKLLWDLLGNIGK